MDRLDILLVASISREVVGEIAVSDLIERSPKPARGEVAYPVQCNRGQPSRVWEQLFQIVVYSLLSWHTWDKEIISVDEDSKIVDSSISEQAVLIVQRLGVVVHLHII